MSAYTKKVSKIDFMMKVMRNGWLQEEDIRRFSLMYDYAEKHDDLEDVDRLMEEITDPKAKLHYAHEYEKRGDELAAVFKAVFENNPPQNDTEKELKRLTADTEFWINQLEFMNQLTYVDDIIRDTVEELFPEKMKELFPEKNAVKESMPVMNVEQLRKAEEEKKKREQDELDRADLIKWTRLGPEQKQKMLELAGTLEKYTLNGIESASAIYALNRRTDAEWEKPERLHEGAEHVRNMIRSLEQEVSLVQCDRKPNSDLRLASVDALRIIDADRAKLSEMTVRNNMHVVMDQKMGVWLEDQEKADFGLRQLGFKPADHRYLLLPDKTNFLLSDSEEMRSMAEMFSTRKTGIIGSNRDTGTYDTAAAALKTYMDLEREVREKINQEVEYYKRGTEYCSEQELRRIAAEEMKKLEKPANDLQKAMQDYLVHVTNGHENTRGTKAIEGVWKSAGAARYAAAAGILERFRMADMVEAGQKYEMTQERVKEITYQRLFVEKMNALQGQGTVEERRIKAAEHAQTELKRKISNRQLQAPSMFQRGMHM